MGSDENEAFEETVKRWPSCDDGHLFPKEPAAPARTFCLCQRPSRMSKVCGTTGVITAHTSCAALPSMNGTRAEEVLPAQAVLRRVDRAFGLTEPGAGTDAQGQQTTVLDEKENWILNGSKIITNAGCANVFAVILPSPALPLTGAPQEEGDLRFIVERTDPASPWASTRRWASRLLHL